MYTVTLAITDGLGADTLTLETHTFSTHGAAREKMLTISDFLASKGYGCSESSRTHRTHRGNTPSNVWTVYRVEVRKGAPTQDTPEEEVPADDLPTQAIDLLRKIRTSAGKNGFGTLPEERSAVVRLICMGAIREDMNKEGYWHITEGGRRILQNS